MGLMVVEWMLWSLMYKVLDAVVFFVVFVFVVVVVVVVTGRVSTVQSAPGGSPVNHVTCKRCGHASSTAESRVEGWITASPTTAARSPGAGRCATEHPWTLPLSVLISSKDFRSVPTSASLQESSPSNGELRFAQTAELFRMLCGAITPRGFDERVLVVLSTNNLFRHNRLD